MSDPQYVVTLGGLVARTSTLRFQLEDAGHEFAELLHALELRSHDLWATHQAEHLQAAQQLGVAVDDLRHHFRKAAILGYCGAALMRDEDFGTAPGGLMHER